MRSIWKWIEFGRKPRTPETPTMCVKIETDDERSQRLRDLTPAELQAAWDRNEPVIFLREPCKHEDQP